jgi:hypothetical protein
MSTKQGATKLTEEKRPDLPEEVSQPEEEPTPIKGKIEFSKGWLITCAVILLVIIILAIIVSVLPD